MRTVRAEFSKKTCEAAWERANGNCEVCHQPLDGRTPIYDHYPVAAALFGPATLENCRVLCPSCNRTITDNIDIPRIAKAKRIEEKRAGLRKPKQKIRSRGFEKRRFA